MNVLSILMATEFEEYLIILLSERISLDFDLVTSFPFILHTLLGLRSSFNPFLLSFGLSGYSSLPAIGCLCS